MPRHIVVPAEWAEQDFVQLTCPHADTDWAYMLDEVNACFANIAREIAKREKLLIVCQNEKEVKALLKDVELKNIIFAELPSNDAWARDHGGITVFIDGRPLVYDFAFNGWGLKFAANHDNQITRRLFEKGVFGSGIQYKDCLDIVLEGGSIESDGKGTLLTTAQCLLAPNRNNKTKEEIETVLTALFGLKQILWLHHGYLAGDDTDSHVDTLARFCPGDTIAYVQCGDEKDEHYDELRKMEEELRRFRTLDGRPYRLLPLPMADAVYDENGGRLPATYANFLVINNAVLTPAYNSPKDERAKRQLEKAFPEREIVSIDCRSLIKQHGSLHCVTMQYPAP
ncbi:MAG: agmatine deiminase family protein [Prevotellaceae bacterium]|nr:agmatine deiminase family protein [Prevotellaceae bacterium]